MVFEQLIPNIGVYLQVARFFLVLAAGIVVTRVVLMPLASRVAARRNGDKVSIHTFSSLTGVIGLFLSFIVALQAAEFGGLVTVLGAITAALTVAIGFGMRDQVSNVVGGLFIYTDHPFVKSDYIRVGEEEGVVQQINLRQTVLNGPSREKLVVPNSTLTLNPVKNFTKGRRTRVPVPLKVDAASGEQMEDIALEAARNNEHVLESPEPEINHRTLEESVLEIELSCWVKDSKDVKQVRSELLEEITRKARGQQLFQDED